MSRILQGERTTECTNEAKLEVSINDKSTTKGIDCTSGNQNLNVNDVLQVGVMLNDLLVKRKGLKTTIKLQIDME